MAAYPFTLEPGLLEQALKQLIVEEADKGDILSPQELGDEEMLFGEHSRLGLDSLDALQITVALQQHFQVRLQGDRAVRQHMMCVRDLAAFVRASHGA